MKSIHIIIFFLFSNCLSFSQASNSISVNNVRIGMSMDELKELLPNYVYETVDAWKYGIDGGGKGIEIKLDNEVQFFIWMDWKTKIITGIVIVSPNIIIDGNVHVGMSLEDFLKKYPNCKSTINLLTSDESCYLSKEGYSVYLETDENNRAAEYNYDQGEPEFVKFIDTNKVIYRITIR